MSFDEAGAVNELTEEIRGMRADFRNALTKLFGDAETENAHGRIPRLETRADDHEKRIGVLGAIAHARTRCLALGRLERGRRGDAGNPGISRRPNLQRIQGALMATKGSASTRRKIERLARAGKSSRSIARELGIHDTTVLRYMPDETRKRRTAPKQEKTRTNDFSKDAGTIESKAHASPALMRW